MTTTPFRPAVAALCVALSACTATKLETKAQLPPPLIEQLPVRVGVHYPEEFRTYVHRETRGTIDYEVTLGEAHVTNLDWLLKAMFREVVPVDDPSRASSVRPPLAFVLEPKFEEFSFLTPKDVAGEAFIVTIRYMLTLYDGNGARVDSFTLTGYGRERARTLASKEPLAIATQRAMRDAGAKVAVELTDQDSVRLLLRGAGSPLPVSPPAPPATLTTDPVAPGAPGASTAPPPAPAEGKPSAPAPEETKPEEAKPEETKPEAAKPEDPKPDDETAGEDAPMSEPPPEGAPPADAPAPEPPPSAAGA
jgi:hypothetical protein